MASKRVRKEVLENNESPSLNTSAGAAADENTNTPCPFPLMAPYLLPRNVEVPTAATNKGARLWEDRYFFEDEVFKFDKKGHVKFGLVVDTADSHSGDEDDDDESALTNGKVRVSWYPGGGEEVSYEAFIGLADRTLMPGDVVRRTVNGRDTQRGYIRDISMRADLKILGTKYVLTDVKTERLRPLTKWTCDTAVCLDSWVGSIKDFEDKATLLSSHGSRIQISSNDYYTLCDPNRESNFNPQIFYTGNVVMGRFHSLEKVKLLTPDRPIKTAKNGKPLADRYIVEDVQTERVWVNWQCKALSEEENANTSLLVRPKSTVTGKHLERLKSLNLYDSCMLQINDRVYVKFQQTDKLMRRADWLREQTDKYRAMYTEQWKSEPLADSATSGTNTSLQSEKSRKKSSAGHDSDKLSNKSKKFPSKSDKVLVSSGKDKAMTIEESIRESTKSSDSSWVTDEDMDTTYDSEVLYDRKCDEDDTEQPRTSPRQSNRANAKKKLARKKAAITQEKIPHLNDFRPNEGEEYMAEALLVYSSATVVWQDGTVEKDIPSTHLYPIHHLDNHEFFPGDFVVPADTTTSSFREYGVVQSVDHFGRIAYVKWFATYSSNDEPRPTYKGESEVSVYDLKDHPDFLYRPGTMVIRVANFVGEDEKSTAGQIVDNFIDGRIKVWWVDGHVSMCWPQDLFEVAQYHDNDWDHEDSDDSWETESEESVYGNVSQKMIAFEESQVLMHVEQTQATIARLEKIFNANPQLQGFQALEKLVDVFRRCRNLDRLMHTKFFDVDQFTGILRRVRRVREINRTDAEEDGEQTIDDAENEENTPTSPNASPGTESASSDGNDTHHDDAAPIAFHTIVPVHHEYKHKRKSQHTNEFAPMVLFSLASTPQRFKTKMYQGDETAVDSSDTTSTASKTASAPGNVSGACPDSALQRAAENTFPCVEEECRYLLGVALRHIDDALSKTDDLKEAAVLILPTQNDSGNYSHSEDGDQSTSGSEVSNASSEKEVQHIEESENGDEAENAEESENVEEVSSEDHAMQEPNEENGSNEDDGSFCCVEIGAEVVPQEACGRFCAILKQQLLNLQNDIREKYYKTDEDFEDELSKIIAKADKSSDIPRYEIKEPRQEGFKTYNTKVLIDAAKAEHSAQNADAENGRDTEANVSGIERIDAEAKACDVGCFQVLPVAPSSHKFYAAPFVPNNPKQFFRAVVREHKMLKESLPPGIWVRAFDDRLDLLSVMIEGPQRTPYEDGLFLFDFQLVRDYPKSPPVCHYISFCSDRLNPNLYEDGKVCVSLLGTWSGRDTEVWGPNSTLLQVIVSIQGLILVDEPYYNEAGYEKQKDTYEGKTNSRMYNEMAIIKLVQATMKMLQNPSEVYRSDILAHFRQRGHAMYNRIKGWIELSKQMGNEALDSLDINATDPVLAVKTLGLPAFPLLPASRGFFLSLEALLETFKSNLETLCAAPIEEAQIVGGDSEDLPEKTETQSV